MNPDPLLSTRTTLPSGFNSLETISGRVKPRLPHTLPQGEHALLWRSNHPRHLQTHTQTHTHTDSSPSLFCKWLLPHHFTCTLQPVSSGERPGSNCGFCASAAPTSKESHLLVSCHRITACRPRGLMTGSILHENTIIALGSIATV